MNARELEARCTSCGAVLQNCGDGRAVRCADCFATYLRGIDAAFLDNLSRFGIRSRQVVAETCLRAVVLANPDDRKLLGMTVYEQFVLAASDLVALVHALRRRGSHPISQSFLAFTLAESTARSFFADLARDGAAGMLRSLDLPHPIALPTVAGMGRTERRDLEKSLTAAVADLERLLYYRDLGERALSIASEHLRGATALADRTQWLAGRTMNAGQVASIALDHAHGRLDIATLRVDEERLEEVVDGVDLFTRLSRNLIHAFLTLREDAP